MPEKLRSQTSKKGFTLIELLVTISIIAVLSAIGIVVYTSVMQGGRDSKRKSDLMAIQSALEQYYTDNGFYPYDAIASAPNDGLNEKLDDPPPVAFTNAVGSGLTASKTYINSLPQDPSDPVGSSRYKYESFPDAPECDNLPSNKCTSYCLYAVLERPPSPLPSPPGSCTYTGSYNYALSLP